MLSKNHGFDKTKRLKTNAEFQAVFSRAFRSKSSFFTVLARPNGLERARLGLVVAKRVIPHAVDRNAFRRLIRESFRTEQEALAGLDIIVLVRGSRGNKQSFNACLRKQWEEVKAQWDAG